jgi:hypothetical protein
MSSLGFHHAVDSSAHLAPLDASNTPENETDQG